LGRGERVRPGTGVGTSVNQLYQQLCKSMNVFTTGTAMIGQVGTIGGKRWPGTREVPTPTTTWIGKPAGVGQVPPYWSTPK